MANDEARRAEQHELVKDQINNDVNSEIAARADQAPVNQTAKINQVADDFRARAVDEVIETDREVERSRGIARVSQVIDYIFYLIYGLLAIRLLLALLAARGSAGFTRFIFAITDPFYAPFRGIVASPSAEGHTLALPIVVALIVYVLLHLAINGLLRLFAHRKTQV